MLKFILPFLFASFVFLTAFQIKNVQSDIFQGLKNNDSRTMVKHFSTTVNLSIKGEEKLYTKFQSELILDDFLKDNKINSLKLVSNGGNKQSNAYVVYEIKTAKENFQVVVKFMEIKGETTIVEFKIY